VSDAEGEEIGTEEANSVEQRTQQPLEAQTQTDVQSSPSKSQPARWSCSTKTPSEGLNGKLSVISSTDSLQGRRGSMEDSHISIDDLAQHYPDIFSPYAQRGLANAFYGIYDGHAGQKASAFVSYTLHHRICQHAAFLAGPLVENEMQREAIDSVCKALEEGFLQTDTEFINDALKAENKWKDGTTAVVALLLHSHLFIANVGDSEALLGKLKYNEISGTWEETFQVLTEMHKPTIPSERARIEEQGGFIVGGRVGGLSVSRAFGDRNMKLPVEEDGFWHGVLVDSHPYIMHQHLSSKDCFLLLGCDGIWENWSHQESVEFVFEKLNEGLGVSELAEAITKQALDKGSQDNISATIVLFRWE